MICLVIFCADLVAGILAPTVALFATSLGASLTFIGLLSSALGVTQLLTSVPIGVQSDRLGRKRVLAFGLLAFAVSTAIMAFAPNQWALLLARMLAGVASVSTFSIGAAYVGDIIRPEERGVAFGLYATAMGVGFTIGPLIGAAVELSFGLRGAYLVATVIGLIGAVVAYTSLREAQADQGGVRTQRVGPSWSDMKLLLQDKALLAGGLGNLVTNITFSGLLVNYFPVYLAQLGVTAAGVSSIFSARAAGSTLARLPSGMITQRLSTWLVIITALAVTLAVVIGMTMTTSIWLLALLLALEGVAYGTFLTAGNAFVAANSTPATRGTAIGVYSMAGSIGTTLSPILLGVVADMWGLQTVFVLTAGLTAVGLAVILYLYTQRRR